MLRRGCIHIIVYSGRDWCIVIESLRQHLGDKGFFFLPFFPSRCIDFLLARFIPDRYAAIAVGRLSLKLEVLFINLHLQRRKNLLSCQAALV